MANISPKSGAIGTWTTPSQGGYERPVSQNKSSATLSAIGDFFKRAGSEISKTGSALGSAMMNPRMALRILTYVVSFTILGGALGILGGGFGAVAGAAIGFSIGLGLAIAEARIYKETLEAVIQLRNSPNPLP